MRDATESGKSQVEIKVRSKRDPRPPEEIAARDRSFGLRSFVAAWKKQQEADRKMREKYASRLIGVLVVQVLLANLFFGLIGFAAWGFRVEPWTAQTFLVTTFLEVSSLVLLVAKYLFPAPTDKALEVISGLNAGMARGRRRRAGVRPIKAPKQGPR